MMLRWLPIVYVLIILRTTFGDQHEFARCAETMSGKGLLLCQCDSSCKTYGDCCNGYTGQVDTDNSTDLRSQSYGISTCQPVAGQPFGVSMVTVPTSRQNRMQVFIQKCNSPNISAPMERLPVHSIKFGVTYRNIFCAVQHHTENAYSIPDHDLSFWTLQITAKCFNDVLANFRSRMFSDLLSLVLTQEHCNVTLVPPEYSTTRICFHQRVDGCDVEAMCGAYQSPVVNSLGQVFKNRHCAKCLGHAETANWFDLRKPVDDKQTMLTLHRIAPPSFPWENRCESKGECHQDCSNDQVMYYDKCIQPIAKVGGFLHEAVFPINSSKAFTIDAAAETELRRVLARYIRNMDIVYMTSSVRSERGRNTPVCKHFVRISLYLTDNISLTYYNELSKHIREMLEVHRYVIESGIMNVAIRQNNEKCSVRNLNVNSNGLSAQKPEVNDMRLIIFVSIGGIVILTILIVGSLRMLSYVLKRRHGSADDESG